MRSVGVALLLVALLFTYQAVRAGLALRQAKSDALSLRSQLSQGDRAGATKSLREIADQSRTARGHTDNALWNVGGRIPLLGENVEAVQVISRVLEETSRSSLPAVTSLLTALREQDLRTDDGRFDLEAISRLESDLGRVRTASDDAVVRLESLDLSSSISPVRSGATTLLDQLRTLRSTVRAGETATRLLPPMLGAKGSRNYLLVVQNNAEVRATGGLPGFLTTMTATDGKLEIGERESSLKFPILTRPVLPLSPGERALYGPVLGEDIRDTNLTPDFPRSAQLMTAMMQREYGQKLDGVVSVDPVALAGVLRATGPIKIGPDVFTADNLTEQLLNRPYQRFDTQEKQNTYFGGVARGIFDALLNEKVNQVTAVRQLARAAGERRLLVWSSDADEKKLIDGTAVAGELPRDTGRTPHVGIYLNDATAAKMQYYLDYTGSLSSLKCTGDGSQSVRAGLVLRSSAPRDVSKLSPFVTGNGNYAPKGSIRTNLRIYAPTGATVTRLEANGRVLDVDTVQHDDHAVTVVAVTIDPGQEVRLQVTVRTRAGQSADPVFEWTPGVRTESSGMTAPSSCT